jgi:secernin
MCDTMVALGNSTRDGAVIFAKNSDREPNEAQQIVMVPPTSHPPGSLVRCTYIEIPQVEHTFGLLLAKPFWIWGAEMGANEHGVAIGNEAVFTRVPREQKPGLIGMDLLRLALERAASARAALDVITTLLEHYGQGGNCGYAHPFYYDNSYLIADPREAWVLETAGRQWAARLVRDIASISNAITIQNEWDLASSGLVDYALDRGWCKRESEFDFARCYSEPFYTYFSAARPRQALTKATLSAQKGGVDEQTLMRLLRNHGANMDGRYTPANTLVGTNVCMHAGFGPIRINQTVGSFVSHLTPGRQRHWLTGTASPCLSIFKPVWLDSGLPEGELSPGKVYDKTALWWRHETLHRQALSDFPNFSHVYSTEREKAEVEFLRQAEAVEGADRDERRAFTLRCFAEGERIDREWAQSLDHTTANHLFPVYYRVAWRKFNLEAGIPALKKP